MANENQYYLYPFGENGDRQTVPDQGAGGNVGFESGYGSDYELPQGDPNRKRIPRLTHNEILYGITKNIKQSQEENWPTWIEDQGDTNPFPYDAGVIVKHPATNQLWISNVDNNQSIPGADTNWTVYQSTSPIAVNKIKTSQFVVEGTTGDPLPSAVPTSYAISAEMAFGWVVTTAVVNATKDSNGNVIADSGVVRYTIDKAENDTPLASQIFASVMRCTNAASSTYVQDYAAAGNGISVSESATEIYIDIDFSDFAGGVVFGASEQRGRLEILSVQRVIDELQSELLRARTWQDVSASRSLGVIYTNNENYDIDVKVSVEVATTNSLITTHNGLTFIGFRFQSAGSESRSETAFTVPSGETYSVTLPPGTIQSWIELRI